ncbi:MAG TPA: radical SAM protein [Vicinamibacterales bacterium]|jgi:MoaA/NifB/PqqE/SkfB family radical SAM enzyme|nr:radical SAM protein [Vicinamibacterales bacterium]
MKLVSVNRRLRRIHRGVREARMLARAFKCPCQPVACHLIPIRRCNLSCAYCNEYDDHSNPVPTPEMLHRIDLLAALGTGILTLSGGEPLLHPALDDLIRHIRSRGMIATVITNGLLLSVDRIKQLNRAGLDHLQISIDNVSPDEVSKKSLKVLEKKLQWLAGHAEFDVTINAVVGAETRQPEDALVIARRASALGFSTTVGILHDHRGQLRPLGLAERQILEEVVAVGESAFDFAAYNRFQKNLARGRPNEWQCRAGSRYLYVCEDGMVHWCSQQRGYPGIPLDRYGRADLEREHDSVKPCAPFCTVGCVHRVAQVDELRENPLDTLVRWFPQEPGSSRGVPVSVKFLRWMFITNRQRGVFRKVALRLFGVK